MKRNLSGIYFRELVDGKRENVCFEDLPDERQEAILNQKIAEGEPERVKNLALMLGKTIKKIGDEFDIIVE